MSVFYQEIHANSSTSIHYANSLSALKHNPYFTLPLSKDRAQKSLSKLKL